MDAGIPPVVVVGFDLYPEGEALQRRIVWQQQWHRHPAAGLCKGNPAELMQSRSVIAGHENQVAGRVAFILQVVEIYLQYLQRMSTCEERMSNCTLIFCR